MQGERSMFPRRSVMARGLLSIKSAGLVARRVKKGD